MRNTTILLSTLIMLGGLFFYQQKNQNVQPQTIGIIVPMEHEALSQIVSGFKEEFKEDAHTHIKVMNAQGDPNIQRALIEQLIREQCALLVPVGTATSQMTLNLAHDQNIICLAADTTLLASAKNGHATLLNDELSASDSLSFLHAAFPQIKKITLLYSSSEKVAKEIPLVIEAAQTDGIEVQQLMVQSLSELYTMSQAIAPDSEAIFILKDHLIVSGIQTIVRQAQKRGIPVMTSDEGSVVSGAAFAIGVKESRIGQQGAQIAKGILNGKDPQNIPPQTMHGPFSLFVNRAACMKQGVNREAIATQAHNLSLNLEYVQEEV